MLTCRGVALGEAWFVAEIIVKPSLSKADLIRAPLDTLLDLKLTDCACGRVHRVPTREVLLQSDAIEQLPQVVEQYLGDGPVVCAVDANTWSAAGEKAADLLKKSNIDLTIHYFDQNRDKVHADQDTVEELVDVIRDQHCSGVLAIGSGTINDICKSASTVTKKPLVTVATAASMNGYTSAISALTVHGLKITESCSPPAAIIADPKILATAPAKMNAAGFGDLLSKNASTADWLMSHQLLGEYYCDLPSAVVEEAIERCISNAKAIHENHPEGLAALIEALLRSGISMVLAGSSSPASGGEHLISHLWDMTAHWRDRSPALHGEQTGVTTLISLALYEKLLNLDTVTIRTQKIIPEFADQIEFENRMHAVFGDIADAILPFARRKYLDKELLQSRRELIASKWEAIQRAVSGVAIPVRQSREYLKTAGAVFRAADIGISKDELAFAVRYARWIRDRYTVLDLAAELGYLDEWLDEIIEVV